MGVFISPYKRLLCAALALVFLAKALIPFGFMPGTDADGKIAIEICTSFGFEIVWVDADDLPYETPGRHDGADHAADLCLYAPVLAQDIVTPLLPAVPYDRVSALYIRPVAPLSPAPQESSNRPRAPPVSLT